MAFMASLATCVRFASVPAALKSSPAAFHASCHSGSQFMISCWKVRVGGFSSGVCEEDAEEDSEDEELELSAITGSMRLDWTGLSRRSFFMVSAIVGSMG